MESYYDILNVDRTASEKEIKKAYARLLRKFPPETHPEEFKKIRKAYEVLSDMKKREHYNMIDRTNNWELEVEDKEVEGTGRKNQDKFYLDKSEADTTILLSEDLTEEDETGEPKGPENTVIDWTIVVEKEPEDEKLNEEKIINDSTWQHKDTAKEDYYKVRNYSRKSKMKFTTFLKVVLVCICWGIFISCIFPKKKNSYIPNNNPIYIPPQEYYDELQNFDFENADWKEVKKKMEELDAIYYRGEYKKIPEDSNQQEEDEVQDNYNMQDINKP